MARKSRPGVLKRQREAKKAEKAAHKREKREVKGSDAPSEPKVATDEDLAGYGLVEEEPEPESQEG